MMHFCIILYAEYKFHRCITMGFICIISVTDTADIFKRSSQVLLDWTLKKSFNRKGFQECPFWKLKWFGLINSWNCWVFSSTKSLFFFFSHSLSFIKWLQKRESKAVILSFLLLCIFVIMKFMPSSIFSSVLLTSYIIKPMNLKVCFQIRIDGYVLVLTSMKVKRSYLIMPSQKYL